MKRFVAIISVMLCVCIFAVCVGAGCGRKEDGPAKEPEAVLPDMGRYVQPDESAFLRENDNGGVIILGYEGEDEYIIIPDELDGAPVTAIGPNAFTDSSVQGVILSDTIGRVEDLAFYNCTSLKEVDCGHGLVELGYGAFEQCYGLERVLLREGLEVISVDAFAFCSSLEEIDIPQSVLIMYERAFYKTGLKSVVVPGNVESIPSEAFYCCESLTSAILSDGIRYIGDNVFDGCTALRSITLPASVTKIGQMITDNADVVIKAPEGSAAEVFAQNYDFAFEKIVMKGED